MLLGPTEASVATPLVFSSLASGTDASMPVKNVDFLCGKNFEELYFHCSDCPTWDYCTKEKTSAWDEYMNMMSEYLPVLHPLEGKEAYTLSAGMRTCIKNADACNYPSAGLLNLCVLGTDVFWCVHIESSLFFHVMPIKGMVCCLSHIH